MKVTDSTSFLSGDNFFPPGFRFQPTDEELVLYYLKRKICRRRLKIDFIGDTDVYKWDPEELPGQSILKTGDRQWFFFTPRDRKYPNGARSNRATMHGYWKATGKDRIITYSTRSVGIKKTLVFYRGRAPAGQRTDWVMHEYTLDEEELKRCQSTYDYYALYKLYKKSGPGPKNGEQYGAPFKEEEWADDDYLNRNEFPEKTNNLPEIVRDLAGVNNEKERILNDLEEFLNEMADEPSIDLDPIVGEENSQSELFDYLSRQINFPSAGVELQPGVVPDLSNSTTCQLQLHESSEVTSVPKISAEDPQIQVPEEDFLEMDDLFDPEVTVQSIEKPVKGLQFDEFDGLCSSDLCHDTDTFFHGENEQISQGFVSHLDDAVENSVPYSFPCRTEIKVSNHQLREPLNDVSQINYEVWMHDGAMNDILPPPSPGIGCEDNYFNVAPPGSNPNPKTKGDGEDSWFSSALWSFLESIPATPASAAEGSALVNKALVRMSSFGRGRLLIERTLAEASGDDSSSAPRRKSQRSIRGIVFFSVLGLLCALLWVFIRASIEGLGRFMSL